MKFVKLGAFILAYSALLCALILGIFGFVFVTFAGVLLMAEILGVRSIVDVAVNSESWITMEIMYVFSSIGAFTASRWMRKIAEDTRDAAYAVERLNAICDGYSRGGSEC